MVPPRGTRPFDGCFRQRRRRPGRACGLSRRSCARLLTVLESRPSSAQHSVVGLPVEMTQSAVPRGLAELQARRRMIAAEAHRRLVPGCNGHGRWRVSAGGGYRRGAGVSIHAQGPGSWKAIPRCSCSGRRPCTGGRAIRGRQDSRAVHDSRVSDGKRGLSRQDVRAVYSPTALCGSFWIHGTHILPRLAAFEYMQAICCREPAFFPSEAPSGTHQADILPWPGAE